MSLLLPDTYMEPVVFTPLVGVNVAVYVVPLSLVDGFESIPPVILILDEVNFVVWVFILKVTVDVSPTIKLVRVDVIAQTIDETRVLIERDSAVELN